MIVEYTHSYLSSLHDCPWWWDQTPTRHFCSLHPGHAGEHVCACGEPQQ